MAMMPEKTTSFSVAHLSAYYSTHLARLHQQLLDHQVTQTYLSCQDIRLDGQDLAADDCFDGLPFGSLSGLEFAHLFAVFNGSRVHQQTQKNINLDDAPPGLYFTVIQPKIIEHGHKNRFGLFVEESHDLGLFIEALHIDHFFLKSTAPKNLGTISFALTAITAHLAGLAHISLIAAGGIGFNPKHIGYKVWPKLGFDAPLFEDEIAQLPDCQTVQDILHGHSEWWELYGSQRYMRFDLSADSASWRVLIPYLQTRIFHGAHEC